METNIIERVKHCLLHLRKAYFKQVCFTMACFPETYSTVVSLAVSFYSLLLTL